MICKDELVAIVGIIDVLLAIALIVCVVTAPPPEDMALIELVNATRKDPLLGVLTQTSYVPVRVIISNVPANSCLNTFSWECFWREYNATNNRRGG